MSSASSVTCPKCGFVSWKTTTCRRCDSSLAGAQTFVFQPPVVLEGEGVPLYFPVSQTKLAVMSISTFGLYNCYWLYQHWKTIKQNDGSDISPFWRTFFAIFYVRPLFRSIKDTATLYGVEANFNPGALMAAFWLMNACARIGGAGWLISLFAFFPLAVAQKVANQINEAVAPGHERNDNFTATNIIFIVLGGLLLALALLGVVLSLFVNLDGLPVEN